MSGAFNAIGSLFGGGGGGGSFINAPPQAAPPQPAPVELPAAPTPPVPVASAPLKSDKDVVDAGVNAMAGRRSGQAATLLTSGLGDTSELKTAKKRLMGG